MAKTYKTWEVIKALTENQNLKFVDSEERTAFCVTGALNVIRKSDGGFGPIDVTEEWKLVQEPVDFMTAAKAYAAGKMIRCEFPDRNTRFYKSIDSFLDTEMKDDKDCGLSPLEILRGKWYIED